MERRTGLRGFLAIESLVQYLGRPTNSRQDRIMFFYYIILLYYIIYYYYY